MVSTATLPDNPHCTSFYEPINDMLRICEFDMVLRIWPSSKRVETSDSDAPDVHFDADLWARDKELVVSNRPDKAQWDATLHEPAEYCSAAMLRAELEHVFDGAAYVEVCLTTVWDLDGLDDAEGCVGWAFAYRII